MKRFTMIVTLVLAVASSAFAQRSAFDKITPELQAELEKRPDANEMFRIIIVMADKYDQDQMSRQVQFMDKTERRAYVIDELQRFSKASQYDLMQLLEEGTKSSMVKEVNPFWIFNGISCVTTREMIATLSQRKDIGCIESDEVRNMLPENETSRVIMEPTRGNAWHVTQVHANDVWSLGYDGTGVVVAIIDTGVNYNHDDLADHMWDGGSQYPHHGYDFCSSTSGSITTDDDPMDEQGHGSHCAGITAGDGTSGTQTGIAPNATIMAVKVFPATGGTSSVCIINGIQFAIDNRADILSLSLGGHGGGFSSYRDIFVNLMNTGIIASIAAGNEGENYISSNPNSSGYYYPVPDNVGSPGNCPPPWHNPDQTLEGGLSSVVTVGASDRSDRKSTFSSYGPSTWATGSYIGSYNDYPYTEGSTTEIGLIKPDIIAPGCYINSLDHETNNGYTIKSGTSMATPLVSGIMALMLQVNPELTPAQIDEILETTALPVEYRVMKNNYTGAGRVDALTTINALLTQATQPTNFSLETCGGNVNLSWTASNAPAGYCIYRDNNQVGTTTETSYSDENVSTGNHVYYVCANDNSGNQSVRSRAVVCIIEPYATIPTNLCLNYGGAQTYLNWDASTVSNTLEAGDLYYTQNGGYSYSFSGTVYFGMRFLPENLRPYVGMSINQISYYVLQANKSYTIRIYRGTLWGNTTSIPVFTQSFTPTSTGWTTWTLSNPYALADISEDLWITISANANLSVYPYSGDSPHPLYLGCISDVNNMIWENLSGTALSLIAHLTRTTNYSPTYDVYLDNSSKATGLSTTTYTDTPTLHSRDNTYYVTSKIGNNESCPSNDAKIIVIDNAQTENNNITIDNSLVYIVNPTGSMTANGNLSCTDPNRLILENGAQLIHNSAGVKATVKKDIAAYTADDNGWYFIASPVTESITPSADNGLLANSYDLYKFDQSEELEWRNIEANSFSTLDHKTGYLYANSGNTTLTFAGTLAATTEPTTLAYDNNASLKGFNLIGNPYPCNTTITNDFYKINGNTVILAQNGTVIAPCEGVFVKATGTGQSVTFSKAVSTRGSVSANCIDLVISKKQESAGGSTTLDRARVRFGEGSGMEKLSLDENHSQLTLWQGGQDYAVAYADGQNELPVNFKAAENGTYTLAFEVENLDLDYLHLIDNMTGDEVDVLAMPTYTFEAKTTDYASRFRLVFAENETDGASTGSAAFAYITDGEILINVTDACDASLQVVDVTGRIVVSVGGHTRCVPTAGMVPGIYVLRLINGDTVRTQKIVIE